MNLQIAELRDAVAGTIGYLWRILGDGLSAAPKRAIVFTLPGVYVRPHDADDATVGTEECIVLVIGDERIVLGTRNAKAEKELDDYLGRERDAGETILSAMDGTNRCIVDLRPNGDLLIKGESSSKSVAVSWDASSGDLNVAAEGDISLTPGAAGTVKLGGSAVDDVVAKANQLMTEENANIGIFNGHVHTAPSGGGPTTTPETPPGTPITQNNLTNAIKSSKAEAK